jgi:hypothetical protein
MTETELSTKMQVPFGLFGLFSLVYSVELTQAWPSWYKCKNILCRNPDEGSVVTAQSGLVMVWHGYGSTCDFSVTGLMGADVEMDCPSGLTGSRDLWTWTLLELPYALQDTFYILTGLLSYCSIQTLMLRLYTLCLFMPCYTLPSYDCYFLRLLYASLCTS